MNLRAWKDLRLGNLFAVAALVLVFASNCLISLFFFRYEAQQMRGLTYANSADSALQASANLDDRLRSILNKVGALRSHDQFAFNSSFGNFIFHQESSYYAVALSDIAKVLAEIRASDPFVWSTFIYTPKGEFSDLLRLRKPYVAFEDSRLYKRVLEAGDQPLIWLGRMQDELYVDGKDVLPVVYPFRVEGYPPVCYFVVYLDADRVAAYLAHLHERDSGGVVLLGPDDAELAGAWNGADPVPVSALAAGLKADGGAPGLRVLATPGGNRIVAGHSLVIAPWRVAVVNTEDKLNASLLRAASFVVAITLAAMLACFAIAVPLSRVITKPLTELERTVRRVADQDFDIRVDYESSNEVGELARNINTMIVRIKELVDARNATIEELRREKELVKTEQLLKRRAELRALQAQINPHFLYNTLNTIGWLADQSGAKEIGRMVENLGRLFQISLNDGREIVSVAEEVEHVGRYLEIQKVRYGEQLSYSVSVEPDTLSCRIIKLVLQPFVENAIVHGLRGKAGGGSVSVSGRLDDGGRTVVFTVSDDGLGMAPPLLAVVRARLASGGGPEADEEAEGYGIYNVNERIKLYYGNGYGVSFESTEGGGTTVVLRVPSSGAADGEPWKSTAY